MKNNIKFIVILILLFLFSILCIDEKGDGNPSGFIPFEEHDKPNGLINVLCFDSSAGISVSMYDGPMPVSTGPIPSSNNIIWDTIAKSGNCMFLISRKMICDKPCSTNNSICVEGDSCKKISAKIYNIGTIHASGIKTENGENTFEMLGTNLWPPNIKLASPAFNEGDKITFSSDGSFGIPAFSVNANGIKQVKANIDSTKIVNGQPLILKWTPPQIAGISTILIFIELYPLTRPTPSGKIVCHCEDTGEYSIDNKLLEQLRALDNYAGFFHVTIQRSSNDFDELAKIKLCVTSDVSGFITFPGLIPCEEFGNDLCPEGMTCQGNICR